MKFTLYTYDLWSDGTTCAECGSGHVSDELCEDCQSNELHTSYSVNDVFKNECIDADSLDDALKYFNLKMDRIEIDNNVDNENTIYFIHKAGKYSGYPACEIRIERDK